MARSAGPGTERGDFSWSGTLGPAPADLPSIHARCQRLRLTGRLLLLDEATGSRSEQIWTGGEPADSEPPPPSLRGRFQVLQQMPDLSGQLTDGVEISGPIEPGVVPRIAALCADYRLSADLLLSRPPLSRAQVRFTYGKAESATIDGTAQMALLALATLSSWEEGSYSVRLRPLFGDDAPAEAPLIIEKTRRSRDFDVTGTMLVPPQPQPSTPARSPAPVRSPAPIHSPPPRPASLPAQASLPPAGRPRRRSRYQALWIGLFAGAVSCGAVLACYFLLRPLFLLQR